MASGVPHALLADARPRRCTVSPGSACCPETRTGWPRSCGCPAEGEGAEAQARGWSRGDVATAIRLVAALNADVKGVAADADYALEKRCARSRQAGGR